MSSVQGIDALLRRLEAIGEPQPVLRVAQLKTVQEAQKLVHRRTGFLQRNIRPGAISATSAKVEARTPYAASLEFGARPHVIRPKNANVLAWGGPRRLTGRLRKGAKPTNFAMLVHHPGNKPYPYLIPGARKAVADLKDVIVTLWNRAA
jgi:hypothetical protein